MGLLKNKKVKKKIKKLLNHFNLFSACVSSTYILSCDFFFFKAKVKQICKFAISAVQRRPNMRPSCNLICNILLTFLL